MVITYRQEIAHLQSQTHIVGRVLKYNTKMRLLVIVFWNCNIQETCSCLYIHREFLISNDLFFNINQLLNFNSSNKASMTLSLWGVKSDKVSWQRECFQQVFLMLMKFWCTMDCLHFYILLPSTILLRTGIFGLARLS